MRVYCRRRRRHHLMLKRKNAKREKKTRPITFSSLQVYLEEEKKICDNRDFSISFDQYEIER